MEKHRIGKSDLLVSPAGLGCWAIGGPVDVMVGEEAQPFGWGDIDDAESARAVHRAIELGCNFFDTANNYGAGHSETVLGRSLEGKRHEVVISTKFATVFDELSRMVYFDRDLPMTYEEIRAACEGSLRRLQTDYVDLYHFHAGEYPAERAGEVREILERLVEEGKIRWYGWSTDDPERARVFAEGEHCASIQYRMNITWDASRMLEVTRELGLGSVIRTPLNSGFLTGKFTPDTTFAENDGRHDFNMREGIAAERIRQTELMRGVLTEGGRTDAQGALGWIWAKKPDAVPIPGFKSVVQAEENVGAGEYGPLSAEQMRRIDELLERV